MHVIAGKAICFGEALRPEFKEYAQQIIDNAKALAETLLAGGVRLVSGGTDNHLMLRRRDHAGPRPASWPRQRSSTRGITVNKNMIPYDERKPLDPSRHPHRHARPDHARHGSGRDAARSAAGCSRSSSRPTTPSWPSVSAATCDSCVKNSRCRPRLLSRDLSPLAGLPGRFSDVICSKPSSS